MNLNFQLCKKACCHVLYGKINLQLLDCRFEGSSFLVTVLTKEAFEYSKFMPEKAQVC